MAKGLWRFVYYRQELLVIMDQTPSQQGQWQQEEAMPSFSDAASHAPSQGGP